MCTLTELFSGEEDRGESPSLSEVVTSEVLRPLADDKEAMERILPLPRVLLVHEYSADPIAAVDSVPHQQLLAANQLNNTNK